MIAFRKTFFLIFSTTALSAYAGNLRGSNSDAAINHRNLSDQHGNDGEWNPEGDTLIGSQFSPYSPSSQASFEPKLEETASPTSSTSSASSVDNNIGQSCNYHDEIVSYLTSNLDCEYVEDDDDIDTLQCYQGTYVGEYETRISYWYYLSRDGVPIYIALTTKVNGKNVASTMEPFSNNCSEDDMQKIYDRVPKVDETDHESNSVADINHRILLDDQGSDMPSFSRPYIDQGCNQHDEIENYLTSNLYCEYVENEFYDDLQCYLDSKMDDKSQTSIHYVSSNGLPNYIALETWDDDKQLGRLMHTFSNNCSIDDMQKVYEWVPKEEEETNNGEDPCNRHNEIKQFLFKTFDVCTEEYRTDSQGTYTELVCNMDVNKQPGVKSLDARYVANNNGTEPGSFKVIVTHENFDTEYFDNIFYHNDCSENELEMVQTSVEDAFLFFCENC